MKWLILLLVFAIVIGFLIFRYRKQIQMGIYVWRMFRKMRQGSQASEKQISKTESTSDGNLVRCAKCGTWTDQRKSIKFRSGINYCSKDCLETAAKVVN